jgi:hypothetical protein
MWCLTKHDKKKRFINILTIFYYHFSSFIFSYYSFYTYKYDLLFYKKYFFKSMLLFLLMSLNFSIMIRRNRNFHT